MLNTLRHVRKSSTEQTVMGHFIFFAVKTQGVLFIKNTQIHAIDPSNTPHHCINMVLLLFQKSYKFEDEC